MKRIVQPQKPTSVAYKKSSSDIHRDVQIHTKDLILYTNTYNYRRTNVADRSVSLPLYINSKI